MLRNRNIAFFIDVDNMDLSVEHFENVLQQLGAMGTIISGKVYGAGERKHKAIHAAAQLKGYKLERQMRIKRRGRKDFDSRIFVDVVDAVNQAPGLDAVCIIACKSDMVYLYSYLRSRGVKVIAVDNLDEAGNALIDEVIDLGRVQVIKLPKKAAKPAVQPAAPAQPDRTEELLREIERLRAQQQPAPAPAPQPAPAPRASYSGDGDLIRQIEDLRRQNASQEDDLVDEIRKLLEGIE